MDYRSTLHLPKTEFPMKAQLPQREPEWVEYWQRIGLYDALRRSRAGRPKFVLHDGPPYANGEIHIGTAMNKVLKDVCNKFFSMSGYDTPYVPGWDTHGLPIEMRALQNLNVDRHRVDPLQLRAACRDYARHYIGVMTGQFERLGVRGDWEHPYVTMDPSYEAAEIRVFGRMYERGLMYKGLRSVHWCPTCETALAEAELEYQEHESPSITVTFPVVADHGPLVRGDLVLAWTTTPWTLPANRAVAAHPEVVYVRAETDRGVIVVAESLLPKVAQEIQSEVRSVLWRGPGRDLEGAMMEHPIEDARQVPLVIGEHVVADEGTGLVHTAPGHGEEDFEIGQRYGLEVVVPLDGSGRFTALGRPFEGLRFDEANPTVIAFMAQKGRLAAQRRIHHQYPYCWRCHTATIFRATEQWFASIADIRPELMQAIGAVTWYPGWGEERMVAMTRDRGDWCVSRQRVWGLPIPALYCENCGEVTVTPQTVEHIASLIAAEGADVWFARPAQQFVPPGLSCAACGGTSFRKETDILDVWYDSGSSHAAVLAQREDLAFPADLYLEGPDQFRGYFNSSLSTSVATTGQAPYRSVVCHGFVVDGDGRKMSKSLGNVIRPEKILEQHGADILRLWVTASDYKADVHVSDQILGQVADGYRKMRNTIRFLLGNLSDFDPARDSLPLAQLPSLERYVLSRLADLAQRVERAYRSYDFHLVYYHVLNFAAVDLSSFYLDVRKDLLYAGAQHERRAAQTVLYELARSLTLLLSPILTFTSEEVWHHLPHRDGDAESVQLMEFPQTDALRVGDDVADDYEILLEVRGEVLKALETQRAERTIGTSLEADVTLITPPAWFETLRRYATDLPTLFIVSHVALREGPTFEVDVTKARGEKCARCWNYREDVGRHEQHSDLCGRCHDVVTLQH